jgi:hypothetical protein
MGMNDPFSAREGDGKNIIGDQRVRGHGAHRRDHPRATLEILSGNSWSSDLSRVQSEAMRSRASFGGVLIVIRDEKSPRR